MSGGVDSSTAAALLQQQGYDVIGFTLNLRSQRRTDPADPMRSGSQAVADAEAVCQQLGIPHYQADKSELFGREVIDYFVEEYRQGRTPNPCVLCNEKLKFSTLLARADELGAGFIATGHYARIEPAGDGQRFLLKRGRDAGKDQSYFLFSLKQHQLARTLLPLGTATKAETRQRARQAGLKTSEKEESMEICFVPDNDYGKFLTQSAGLSPHRGDIVDGSGRVLGRHDGIEFFTIGQRKGIRVAHTHPLYVVDLDPVRNQVTVGPRKALEKDRLIVGRCNWIAFDSPPSEFNALAQIRYRHPGAAATVRLLSETEAEVRFLEPQRAITPGQACVFYDGDTVLGGGWIQRDEAFHSASPA